MNTCILCEENNAGFKMICDECREAFKYYKTQYKAAKILTETTEADEIVFEKLCESMRLKEIIDDEKNDSLFPSTSPDPLIEYLNRSITEYMGNNDWMKQQPGRFENFLKYVENKVRSAYKG